MRSETCTTAGTYAEMSGCTFDPSKDYSCYKIPTGANAACPAGVTPQGPTSCDVPHCTLCNSLQGIVGGQYFDSAGAPEGRLVHLPGAERERATHVDLRQRHRVAVPARRRLRRAIGPRRAAGPEARRHGRRDAGGGAGGTFGEPKCPSTVMKGGSCGHFGAASSVTTHVEPTASAGRRRPAPASGTYAEMAGCVFNPSQDYSCYRIPSAANSGCAPGGRRKWATHCDVGACAVCNSIGGVPRAGVP